MPGTNGGTGAPHWLRCSMCRRSHIDYGRAGGTIDRLKWTGKISHIPPGHYIGHRAISAHVQYKCRDCGHVGWTKHMDALRLLPPELRKEIEMRRYGKLA